MAHPSLSTHWPLFGLVVRTPRLELRFPDDDLACGVAETAALGIHDPEYMPFSITWTEVPPPQQQRNTIQFLWSQRATWKPDDWHLTMAVVIDGEPAGVQGVGAKHFALRRVASTGSWLGRRFQGHGYGKEMRAAILHLMFEGLGATRCESGAWADNAPSLGVSRSLGYEENGDEWLLRRGVSTRQIGLSLSRERWEAHRPSFDITIEGLEECREMFGDSGVDEDAGVEDARGV